MNVPAFDPSTASFRPLIEPFPMSPSVAPRKMVETHDLRPTMTPEARLSMKPERAASSSVAVSAAVVEPSNAASIAVPAPRFGFRSIAVTVIVMANVGLAAGLIGLRREEHHAHAPVAGMSAEVKELHSAQTATNAQLEDTRGRLDKQEATLAKTIEKLTAAEQRQREADHRAREHAEREAKEIAALNARMGSVERKVDYEVHTIDEALKIIDSAQGGPPSRISDMDMERHPTKTRDRVASIPTSKK